MADKVKPESAVAAGVMISILMEWQTKDEILSMLSHDNLRKLMKVIESSEHSQEVSK